MRFVGEEKGSLMMMWVEAQVCYSITVTQK